MYVFFGLLDCFTDCFVDLRIDLRVGFQVVLQVFRCFAEQDGQSRAGLWLGGQGQGQSSTDCYRVLDILRVALWIFGFLYGLVFGLL